MKNGNVKTLLLLHLLLAGFSLSGVFTKLASGTEFLSRSFILYYGIVIFILGVYAIAWQQVIKRMPLTSAYANRAVTVVWGIVWGLLFFGESINAGKIAGAIVVIAGVLLYVKADAELTLENVSECVEADRDNTESCTDSQRKQDNQEVEHE